MAIEYITIRDADGVDRKVAAELAPDGSYYQVQSVAFGVDGAAPTLVSASNPLPVDSGSGTFGYDAGTATGTVDVPANAKLRCVSVVAGAAANATITIGGGDTITVLAGGDFTENEFGATTGMDVVIGGTVRSYYVSWTT